MDDSFGAMIEMMGIKLVLKKIRILGGREAFVHHHMKSLKESVTSGLLVIKAKDVLVFQMLKLRMAGNCRLSDMSTGRSLFYYHPFLSDIPKFIKISNPKTGMASYVTVDETEEGSEYALKLEVDEDAFD